MHAKDIMTKNVIKVKPDTAIIEVIDLLVEHAISGVPVVDDENKVVGVITEYDLIFKEKLPINPFLMYHYGEYDLKEVPEEQKKALCDINVGDVMTPEVICVDEDTPAKDIVRLMVEKKVKRVPVTKNGELSGIIARRDVLKEIFRLVCWT